MSQTKLNKEIENYLKQNNLPYKGKSTDSEAETDKRLCAYKKGKEVVFNKWIEERKYKELISCAHGRWFPYEEFTKPLAKHFIKKKELLLFKFLCEREIRFKIEDTIKCLKHIREDYPEITDKEIVSYNLEEYLKIKSYHPIGELYTWKEKSISLLNRYIELIKETNDKEYLVQIEVLKEKTQKLTIKKSDLKHIKHKLKKN